MCMFVESVVSGRISIVVWDGPLSYSDRIHSDIHAQIYQPANIRPKASQEAIVVSNRLGTSQKAQQENASRSAEIYEVLQTADLLKVVLDLCMRLVLSLPCDRQHEASLSSQQLSKGRLNALPCISEEQQRICMKT